jgi:hypothetical protein
LMKERRVWKFMRRIEPPRHEGTKSEIPKVGRLALRAVAPRRAAPGTKLDAVS